MSDVASDALALKCFTGGMNQKSAIESDLAQDDVSVEPMTDNQPDVGEDAVIYLCGMRVTRLLTPKDVAAFCGFTTETLRNLCASGRGPRAVRLGRVVRFDAREVERWIAEHTEP